MSTITSAGMATSCLNTASRKKVSTACERRAARCEAPRRGDAGTSSRSGTEADGRPPPQDVDTFFRDAVLRTRTNMRKLILLSLFLLVALNALGHAGEVHTYMGTVTATHDD